MGVLMDIRGVLREFDEGATETLMKYLKSENKSLEELEKNKETAICIKKVGNFDVEVFEKVDEALDYYYENSTIEMSVVAYNEMYEQWDVFKARNERIIAELKEMYSRGFITLEKLFKQLSAVATKVNGYNEIFDLKNEYPLEILQMNNEKLEFTSRFHFVDRVEKLKWDTLVPKTKYIDVHSCGHDGSFYINFENQKDVEESVKGYENRLGELKENEENCFAEYLLIVECDDEGNLVKIFEYF